MKVLRSVFTVLLTVTAVLAAVLVIAMKSGFITDYAKDYVEAELFKATGRNIHVGAIKLGFVDNIIISNVSIPAARTAAVAGEIASIKKVIIRFNFVDYFLKKRNMETLLSHIIVDGPAVNIEKDKGVFNISRFFETPFPEVSPSSGGMPALPVNRILIENGVIKYFDADKNFSTRISSLKGSFTLVDKNSRFKIFLAGKTPGSDRKNFSVNYSQPLNGGDFGGVLSLKDELLSNWAEYVSQPGQIRVNGGKISLLAKITGAEFKPDKMKISANAAMQGGMVQFINGPYLENISGVLNVENSAAEITGISFDVYGGKGIIKAKASDIYEKPFYDGVFSLSEIKAEQINKDILSGSLRAAFNFKGYQEDLKAEGGLFWDKGALWDAPIKSLRADLSYDAQTLNLKSVSGTVGGGTLGGKGKIQLAKDKKIDLGITLRQLHAEKISSGREFAGIADINFNAYGTLVTPGASALIKSGMLSFKGSEIRNVTSAFTFSKGSFKAVNSTVFDYGKYSALKLDAGITVKDDIISASTMTLKDKNSTLVKVAGDYGIKTKQLNVNGQVNGLVISKADIAYFRGKDIDGIINALLEIKGAVDSPQIALDVKSDRLEIKGQKYTVKGRAELAKNELKVSGVDFSGGFKGSAEFSLKNKLFQINADIKGLKGGVVKEITGIEFIDNSVINGGMLVKKEATGYGGKIGVDVKYGSGIYRSIELKAQGAENQFAVEKFDVNQSEGSLVSSGTCTVTNGSDVALHMNGRMKNYQINRALKADAALSNSIVLNLAEDMAGIFSKFKAENIYFNGNAVPVLDVTLRGKKGQDGEFRASWGETYSAAGKFIYGDKPLIDALIKIKDADLYPVYRLAGLKRDGLAKDSLLRGEIKVSGEAKKASVNAEIVQDTGLIKLNGKMAFDVKGDKIKAREISADYNVVNMDIKKAASIFDSGFEGSGRLNGSGKLGGRPGKLEALGDFLAVDGRIAGMDFNDLEVKYAYKDRKLFLEKALLYYRKTSLDLAGSTVTFADDKTVFTDIKMQALDYKLQGNRLNGYLGIAGRLVTGDNALFDGSFAGDGFQFKNHTFNPFIIKVNYSKDGLLLNTSKGAYRLKGDIGFEKKWTDIRKFEAFNQAGVKVINASGRIMSDSGDSAVDINCQELDPQLIDGLIGLGFSWEGTAAGNVKLSGNGKEGIGLTIQVAIKNGSFAGIEFDVLSGVLSLKNDWLDMSPIGPIILTKDDKYELTLGGKIPVPMTEEAAEKMRGEQMDLKAHIKDGDLSILKFLGFIEEAQGVTNLTARITGTKEFPSVTGKIDVTDGNIKLKYLFKELSHVYANILIRDNVIDIYDLKGDTERGTIKIQNLDEKKGGIMKFVRPDEVNWRITNIGDRIRFTDTPYMEFLRGDADIDLAMTGKLEAPFIKGTIKASDFTYLYPIKSKTKAGEDTTIKDEDNFAKKITWDVQLTGGDNVRFYSNYLNNYADVYIKFGASPLLLQDKGNSMKLTGNLNIIRGVYKYMNTDFIVDDLRESKVVFDGSTRPVLDVFASAKFRRMEVYKANGQTETMDLKVNLHAYGKVGNLKIDLTSDPILPEIGNDYNRLLYIVTVGRDMGDTTNLKPEDFTKMADAIASFWIKKGTEQIQVFLPVSVLKIDAKLSEIVGQGTDSPESTTRTAEKKTLAEVEIGQYITDKFYLGYTGKLVDTTGIMEEAQSGLDFEHTLGMEYTLDDINKLIFHKSFGNPYLGGDELYLGYELRWQFDSWGAKPRPTPAK
ncbi:MAG: hypothetical protein CVV21_09725 [Candidatus Goldiibacteriota bacterium HGW-Goldbacteria-1]|nr:MAG: hypothetical protein CVV21_09725 [Candidatus Goldiibacteriota bacterium HGW-Goldbacteria-1]